MTFFWSATPTQRQLVGGILLTLVVGWLTFRIQARLATEPYVDFQAFYLAAQAARTGNDPYRAGTEMYIYPPMLAAWMAPLSLLPLPKAAWVWFALSLTATLVVLLMTCRIILQRLAVPSPPGTVVLLAGLTALVWMTTLRWEFEQGQTDWLMLAGICLALASLDKSPLRAGLALGFAINIKYLPLALVAYLIVRRRWREVIWSAVGTVVWSLAPALVYGWQANLRFLGEGLAGLAKLVGVQVPGQAGYVFPLTYDRSITLPSALGRWAEAHSLGLAVVIGLTALVAALIYCLGIVLYRLHDRRLLAPSTRPEESSAAAPGLQLLEFVCLLGWMLVFSPQAMMRHFFLVLPLVATALALALWSPTRGGQVLASLAVAFGALGTIGADLFSLVGQRDGWKSASGMSWCMVAVILLTLWSGLKSLKPAEKHGGPENCFGGPSRPNYSLMPPAAPVPAGA
jgi:hypothetical protein